MNYIQGNLVAKEVKIGIVAVYYIKVAFRGSGCPSKT